MGDTARRVFTGARALPRAFPAPPSATITLTASMLRLAERINATDTPARKCSVQWCTRRPMPNGEKCGVCSRAGGDPVEHELSVAGWTPVVARGRRQGWRDPVTGAVLAARVAVVVVRRDAKKGGAGK